MAFIQSLGVFGWCLVGLALACLALALRKKLAGRAEPEIGIQTAKSTLTAPPSVGGGIGGNP